MRNKRVIDKLSDSSKTSVNVRGIGIAEINSRKGYIPAVELSIGDSVETVFLDENPQSKKQALKKIANIPDVRNDNNLFVRDNTIYYSQLGVDEEIPIVLSLSLLVVFCNSMIVLAVALLGIVAFPLVFIFLLNFLLLGYFVSTEDKAFDFEPKTDYTINRFTDYETDGLFNQQSVRAVEISLRDDNGLNIETEDGTITWTVEGDGRVPDKDISEYRIGDNSSEITSVEKAYVEEYSGASEGLVSDCGDYVIPICE